MMSHEVTPNGIVATFKIANTMAGEDALVEATEGLRDGFSVGAQINEWTNHRYEAYTRDSTERLTCNLIIIYRRTFKSR